MRLRLLFALIALVLLGASPHVQAQEPGPREHLRAGVEFDKAGNSLEALAAFQRAYELQADYAVLYNIAQEQYKLGRPAEAAATLRLYLELGGKAIDEVRRRRLALQLQQYESLLSHLTLTSSVAGAEVQIDQQPVGATPMEVTLTPGVHLVVVTFGDTKLSTPIKLAEGEHAKLDLEPAPPQPAPAPATKCPSCTVATGQQPRPATQGRSVSLATILAGSGLVVGGAAAVIAIWNHESLEQWQARDAELRRDRSVDDYLLQVREHNESGAAVENWGIASLALGIGGAALLAAGGTLFVMDVTRDDHPKHASKQIAGSEVILVLDRSMGALAWKGVF